MGSIPTQVLRFSFPGKKILGLVYKCCRNVYMYTVHMYMHIHEPLQWVGRSSSQKNFHHSLVLKARHLHVLGGSAFLLRIGRQWDGYVTPYVWDKSTEFSYIYITL